MKNKANEIKTKICIPKGTFGGNCSGCRYWEEYNRDSSGRAYCSYYDDWLSIRKTRLLCSEGIKEDEFCQPKK